MNFYFSLKVVKEREQKSEFSKNDNYCPSKRKKWNKWNKKLHLNTNKDHHKRRNSIHCSGFPDITQFINGGNCFVHSSIRWVFSLKECKADAQFLPFTVHRSQWKEHRIKVCSRLVSSFLRVLIGHRVSIISAVEWHRSWWNHVPEFVRVQKDITAMLLINRTVMLILARMHLGFLQDLEM